MAEIRRRSRKNVDRVARLLSYHEKRFPNVIESVLEYYRLLKLSTVGQSFVVHLPSGLRIEIPKSYVKSYLSSIDDVYVHREYDLLPNYRPSLGDVVFDVGAFIGLYALKCSTLVGNEGRIYAIEPLPSSYSILLNNARINSLENVVPINVAMAAFEGLSDIYFDSLLPVISSMYAGHIETWSRVRDKIQIEVTTLDALVNQYDLDNIDLLKVDVEGAELDVLKGGIKALQKGIVERMIVEIHETCAKLKDITTFLRERSYLVDGVFPSDHLKRLLYAKVKR